MVKYSFQTLNYFLFYNELFDVWFIEENCLYYCYYYYYYGGQYKETVISIWSFMLDLNQFLQILGI